MLRLDAAPPMPLSDALADWRSLLPGIAIWALALYVPLSLQLGRLEEGLASGPLAAVGSEVVLVLGSLILALVAGLAVDLLLGWTLGPGWASSLGVLAALWGPFLALASRKDS
jgi:hypothetical protein